MSAQRASAKQLLTGAIEVARDCKSEVELLCQPVRPGNRVLKSPLEGESDRVVTRVFGRALRATERRRASRQRLRSRHKNWISVLGRIQLVHAQFGSQPRRKLAVATALEPLIVMVTRATLSENPAPNLGPRITKTTPFAFRNRATPAPPTRAPPTPTAI